MADETAQQPDYSKVPPQLRPHVFKPGQSGNPAGRPKGRTLEARLRELMDQEDPGWKDKVLNALLSAAASGNVQAINVVFDRIDGKVPDAREDDASDDPLVVAELLRERHAPEAE